jgi:hypothetical protein
VVRCCLPSIDVTFTDAAVPAALRGDSLSTSRVLVIGAPWSPSAADCFDLRNAGFTSIVCSRFEQGETDWPDSEVNPDHTPPDFVFDLSRLGVWRP